MTLISKTYWGGMPFDFQRAPEDALVAPVKLRTQDHRELRGLRWSPTTGATRGVLLMHPRVDFTRHYAIPRLVAAGLEVLALNSRNPNDDTDKEITPRADHHPVERALAGRATIETIEGAGHYFEPPLGETRAPHVERLMDTLIPWLRGAL